MKLVFCGTPQFAVPTLEALVAAGHQVTLALTQPDRPVGRNAEIKPTPVKAAALAHGIPVQQPEKIKTNEALRAHLEAIAPDAIIVVAYGRILPQWMLDLPRYGSLNGHASLLPRWRGAAPIQWAIASGDHQTGVTTMRLDAGLDTGPMLLRRSVPITPETTAPDLFQSLAVLGAELMIETLDGLAAGTIQPEPQGNALATHARPLIREDGQIDWTSPAAAIDARFRGFQPWPGAFTSFRGKKLIIHAMQAGTAPAHANSIAGQILKPTGVTGIPAIPVACGDGHIALLHEVQLEGKKRICAADFLRGHQIHPGELLG
ncbi:methionyl-tRNA formyltransferase [Terriglobus sp.]|uniref:methionyl-tRNA formyltransferase n=1 Tax=Terriglobus sp. TaxID=1889013 RepID=UPI003B00F89E